MEMQGKTEDVASDGSESIKPKKSGQKLSSANLQSRNIVTTLVVGRALCCSPLSGSHSIYELECK